MHVRWPCKKSATSRSTFDHVGHHFTVIMWCLSNLIMCHFRNFRRAAARQYNTSQTRLDSSRPVTETRIKMVAAWKCLSKSTFFCSVLWLLLFTSSCDAVHPSAVYRSFHQNDRFTVPFSNSTLSPKCQAAYDRLRNSSVAESTVCK